MEIVPSYYHQFKCTAGKCRHNCCIGWEVDIDDVTLQRYETLKTPLGENIRKGIQPGRPACFRMEEGSGRCAMLREDNLCEIQRELGESALSQICRDHPRYRVFLPGRTEMGLGLCCEEAVRLLLQQREPLTLPETDTSSLPRQTRELLRFRERLLLAAHNRRRSLPKRLVSIHALAEVPLLRQTRGEWCELMLALEPLEPNWNAGVELLREREPDWEGFRAAVPEWEREGEQLLSCFLLRHVLADGGKDMGARTAFAVWSTVMIHALQAAFYTENGGISFSDRVELCRLFSANVEYCGENMERLLDLWR